MSVSSISGASSITQLFSSMFTAKGVSEEKATQVATSVDSVLSSTSVASIVSPRQAIEEKLTSSVQDGTLTEKDASLIRTALNEFESSASGSTAPAGGPPPGGPPPGGAPAGGPPPSGGGGSSVSSTDDEDDDEELTAFEELMKLLEEARTEAALKGDNTQATSAVDFLKNMTSGSLVDTQA